MQRLCLSRRSRGRTRAGTITIRSCASTPPPSSCTTTVGHEGPPTSACASHASRSLPTCALTGLFLAILIQPHADRLSFAPRLQGGESFTKPSLGIAHFNGSTANNIVWPLTDQNWSVCSHGVVFRDSNPSCPESERFKFLVFWLAYVIASPSCSSMFHSITISSIFHSITSRLLVFW
eukprot:SAG31_NODE_11432_length_1031_cov_1.266094_1_plen_178_part_00